MDNADKNKKRDVNNFLTMINAYKVSRVLLTAMELELFTVLENGAQAAETIAHSIKTHADATRRILNVLVSLGFITKKADKYSNNLFSSKYLVKGKPDYISNLSHTNHLWDRWSHLTEVTKKGKPVIQTNINQWGDEQIQAFIEAMDYRAKKDSQGFAQALDLTNVQSILDVGGGSGAYSLALINKKKEIKATILDLPEVIPLTQAYITNQGYQDSFYYIEGNYKTTDYGKGYDLILFCAIIHINNYQENQDLMQKAANALNPGGQIVIKDFIVNDDKTHPLQGTLFSINMLVSTEAGDTYSMKEIKEWFHAVGITKVEILKTEQGDPLVIGIKNK